MIISLDGFVLECCAALDRLRRRLIGKVHMTLIIRIDDDPDRDIVVSDDDHEQVIAAMRRSQEREQLKSKEGTS